MDYPKGQHPGTRWKRSDFQCHTPRDIGWKGGPDLPGGYAEGEAARTAWAEEFLRECDQRGLSVVAVTDHHDAGMVPYIQTAAAKKVPSVTVFPGVEITCKDNAQCLAILDPKCGWDVQQKLLHTLTGIMPANPASAKTNTVTCANPTVEQLFDAIANEPTLRDVTLLVPHFSNEDAHKSLNAKGHHPRFAQLECDGVYVERSYASLDAVTVDKIRGEVPEWGTRRRAILTTGDNRSATWDRLGVHECWIKLGETSVEGVRQAFLADESRIAYVLPVVASERVVRLTVQSELTGPKPFTVTFNEGLTTIIGGRGSGKTALLEYVRFGLGRSERDLPPLETGPVREREAQLVDDTLVTGFVEVELDRAGVTETWRRKLDTRDYISATDAQGTLSQLTLEEARRRFPARAFHQKGLSSTTRDLGSAADQITGIAAAEAIDRRREIDQQIANAKRQVTTAMQQLAAHWQHRLERQQAQARVDDLKNRLEVLAQRLKDEGVSDQNLELLKSAPSYSRGKAYFNNLKTEISDSYSAVERLSGTILNAILPDSPGFPEVAEANRAAGIARQTIVGALNAVLATLNDLEMTRQIQCESFNTRDDIFQQQHALAVSQQTAQRALVDENTRLATDLGSAEAAKVRAMAAESDSKTSAVDFADARAELARLVATRRRILEDAAVQVAGKSSKMLKARVKRDPRPAEYLASVATLLDKSYVADAHLKCEEWIAAALARDAENFWTIVCDKVLTAYEAKIIAGSPDDPGRELSKHIQEMIFDGSSSFTENQLGRIYGNLTDATVSAVVSSVPRDYIILNYVEDGRSMPFEKASPGQQASALLELLLSQSAGTLIIDQPEDDIDNRIIMKVVKLIRSSKHRRQLIFATHNANIVVNGDADKVIALTSGDARDDTPSAAGKIDINCDGAIETESVRADITRIMEGGRDAFRLRNRKYRFDQEM